MAALMWWVLLGVLLVPYSCDEFNGPSCSLKAGNVFKNPKLPSLDFICQKSSTYPLFSVLILLLLLYLALFLSLTDCKYWSMIDWIYFMIKTQEFPLWSANTQQTTQQKHHSRRSRRTRVKSHSWHVPSSLNNINTRYWKTIFLRALWRHQLWIIPLIIWAVKLLVLCNQCKAQKQRDSKSAHLRNKSW